MRTTLTNLLRGQIKKLTSLRKRVIEVMNCTITYGLQLWPHEGLEIGDHEISLANAITLSRVSRSL